MKRFGKRVIAAFLAIMMVCGTFLNELPVMAGTAIPQQKEWYHLKSGTGNGNGHFGSAKPEAFILTKNNYGKENFSFTMKLNSELSPTRFRFVTKYVDANDWGYIAYDGQPTEGSYHWFYEYKNSDGNKSGYPDISDFPKINKGDVVNFTGTWNEDTLNLTVLNVTTAQTGTAAIENADFAGVCSKTGQMGFGAGVYSGDTDINFCDFTVGEAAYTDGYKWYAEKEGQIFESVTDYAYRLKAGEGNGNGHFGGGTPEAFALSEDTYGKADFSFTMKLKSEKDDTRFRFVPKYADDDNWSYIGYDKGNWYYQFQLNGQESYPGIAGFPEIKKGDVVNFTGTWTENVLALSVLNETTGATATTNIDNADFAAVCEKTGKMGFGGGTFGTSFTEFEFSNAVLGDSPYKKGWDWYKDGLAGQTLVLASDSGNPADPTDPTDPTDPAAPEGPQEPDGDKSGKRWLSVEAGSNNAGGHAYGSDKGPAFLYDADKTMPKDGVISLTFTPLSDIINYGIFYTYQDDKNWLYLGYDQTTGWYYQYNLNGSGDYPKLGGLPSPEKGQPMAISVSLSRETLSVTVNGVNVKVPNQKLFDLTEAIDGQGKFGVMTKNTNTAVEFSDFVLQDEDLMNNNWKFLKPRVNQKSMARYAMQASVAGKVVDKNDAPIENATVYIGLEKVKTDSNGAFLFPQLEVGDYSASVSKPGYRASTQSITLTKDGLTDLEFVLHEKGAVDMNAYDYISSDSMKAYIGKDFPVVLQYEVGQEVFYGQDEMLENVAINGVSIKPVVTPQAGFASGAKSKTYSLAIKDEDGTSGIDLVMDVKISIDDNDLTWEVTSIAKNEGCPKIKTINVPNLNLLTIDTTQEGAAFAGAKASTDTTVSGDVFIGFEDGFAPSTSDSFLYAFVTSDKLSAGLWSNSEAEGDKRITLNNGADTMSLTSSPWYYEQGDKSAHSTSWDFPVKSELPYAKVAISGDLNKDGIIDWNDGALGLRDIMSYAQGSEVIKEMVNYRIIMNFASMAPNPFLKTADNVKKVYLATDGLSQSLLLKGYGNEGHDSANSEYADIGERLGGVDDFQSLIKMSHNYNTEVGIHVNAQEAYPEAASFNDKMVTANDGKYNGQGWGWLDQSFVINKQWDLSSQARWKRFVQLYDRINETSFYSRKWPLAVGESEGTAADLATLKADAANQENNMDFIYLDVWYQDAWETRRIAEEVNSLGWRFSTEFSGEGEYDSTWQHWSTDAAYGGKGMKGYNSSIIRFLRNDQRDSQVLNYPSFGGAADNPLLGGYRLYGFEGWGGDQDFNNYIFGTYNENLPTKFLQHYYVTKWENYGEGETSPTQNQEKQITLENADGDVVVVTRKQKQRNDQYIERVITLNGKKVLDDVTYLLPWADVETNEKKLYHWNMEGGTTTWELQDDWKNLGSVDMYELTDQGRTNKKTIQIVNGKVTLEAKAATAYIIVKSNAAVKTLKAPYGEDNYVADPGFNGYAGKGEQLSAAIWSGDITDSSISVKKSTEQKLVFDSPKKDVAVSTQISGLTPGRHYVAEINVENYSNAKAIIEVTGGEADVSNYTLKSIAKNYVRCDEEHTSSTADSYMQVMQVSFVAKTDKAILTLKREAGKGVTRMDDIRIVEKELSNYKADGSFEQDFETVVQGLYPFVLGSAQGVDDPCTHLSQLHAPYTQAGWNGKILDDVLGGNWSLKHHNKNTGIIYQTIPQNFRFEKGKIYKVSFDYQSGPDGAYAFVVGNGENYQKPDAEAYLPTTISGGTTTTQRYEMQVMGSKSGQTWIGLYENASKIKLDNALGGFDFVLDNLKIEEDPDAFELVASNTTIYKGETAELDVAGAALEDITWDNSNSTVAAFDEERFIVSAKAKGTATITASVLKDGVTVEKSITITVLDEVTEGLTLDENAAAYANTYQPDVEDEGIAAYAIDGRTDTIWHSAWDGFTVSEQNPALLTIDLGKPVSITGIQFLQRASGGQNGLVNQFQYVTGNEFDTQAHTITDGQTSDTITASSGNGEWEKVVLDAEREVRYIQLRVLKGYNDFAAVAEISPIVTMKVSDSATLEISGTSVEVGSDAIINAVPDKNKILKGIVWSSSDESIAELEPNKNGTSAVIKAYKPGAVTITITNASGIHAEKTIDVVDMTALKAAVSAAKALDLNKYADGTNKEAFKKALADAQAAINHKGPKQAELDQAAAALEAAQSKLQLKANKAALQTAVTAAGKLDLKKYADDANKTAFQKALDEAKKVLNNESLSQADQSKVDQAATALKNAQGKLVLIQDISKAVISKIADQTYTGKALTPSVTVKYGTATLKKNTDYTISYSANKNIGKATVTITGKGKYSGSKKAAFTIIVKKNKVYTVSGYKYKITNANTTGKGTVSVVGTENKKMTSISIKDTVKIGGKTFKITEIGASAFKKCTKAKSVSVGKNVTTIGANAFSGCKSLKTITIKSTSLKKVGKNAFKGINANAKIKVPAKKLSSYQKLLKSKGQGKNVKITK